MSTITNNIFSTVSMLADKAIASFKPDKSVTGIITSTSKDLEGVYGVLVNSTNFTAKSIGNEQYNIGDVVYLLIPDNDLSNMKFILGSTNKKSSNLTEENSIDKEFSFLGSGIIINKYKGKDNPDIVFTPSTTSSTPVEKTKWVTTSITKKGEDSSRVVYATTLIYLPDIANEDLTINQMKVTVSTGGSIILSDLKLLQMTIDNIGDLKYNLTYYFNDNVASGGYDNPATAVSFEITYSGYEYESEIIYSYNKGVKNPHKNIVDTEVFYDDLAALESKFKDDTTAFIVSADFKSNYLNIQTGGVFGIKVKIKYTDGEREYIFSSSEMQAENVYMMLDYTELKKAFENINNETFEYISEISIFNTMGSGLGVKNLKIYGAKRVASSIPTYTLSIDSVTGVTDISNLEASNITLKAVLKDPSQKVILNATYTWYQENVTVEDGASEKGGAGWAPLLDNNIDNELTISSSSQFTSASCRFKCIATTSSGMSFDAYYTLYNKNGINLSLTRKDNTLTCEVKQGEVIVDSGLKYKWLRKLNNSSTWIDIDNESNSWDVTPSGIYISEIYRCTVNKLNNEYIGYVETKVYNPKYENVRTIELYYMRSDSYTKAPPAEGEGANWQKTIPEETGDQIYIWLKTVTIYEDGREVVNSIVLIKGILGENGVGLKEQLFLYAYTYSVNEGTPIAPPIPSFPEESIIEISSTSINVGEKGITKDDLVKVTGYYNDGTPIQYELNYDDGDNLLINISVPEGKEFIGAILSYRKALSMLQGEKEITWKFNTQPVTKELPYQWKYTFIIYTDDTYVTDGPTLEAIWADGIESIKTQWAASDSGTNAPAENSNDWKDVFSDVANTNKQYIWVREEITYKSTAVSHTTPRVDLANNAIKNWAISTDLTYINGAKIYTGTIDASKISVDDLSATNATIGGWSVNQKSLYNDGLLISAKEGDLVLRIAAAGENSVTNSQNVDKTVKMVATFKKSNETDSKADYFATITVPPYIEVFNENTLTKVHITYLTTASVSGLYTDKITPNIGLIKIDTPNRTISYDLTHEPSVTKIEFIILYTVNEVQSISDPVFLLLSNGTGTIGGWDIAEDGLSKVEGDTTIELTVNDNKRVPNSGEVYRLKVESKLKEESPVYYYIETHDIESDSIGGAKDVTYIEVKLEYPLKAIINNDTSDINIILYTSDDQKIIDDTIYLSAFEEEISVSALKRIYSYLYTIDGKIFIDVTKPEAWISGIPSYTLTTEFYVLKNGAIYCTDIQGVAAFDSEYIGVKLILEFANSGSSIIKKLDGYGVNMSGLWTLKNLSLLTEYHYNELKRTIDLLIEKIGGTDIEPTPDFLPL